MSATRASARSDAVSQCHSASGSKYGAQPDDRSRRRAGCGGFLRVGAGTEPAGCGNSGVAAGRAAGAGFDGLECAESGRKQDNSDRPRLLRIISA